MNSNTRRDLLNQAVEVFRHTTLLRATLCQAARDVRMTLDETDRRHTRAAKPLEESLELLAGIDEATREGQRAASRVVSVLVSLSEAEKERSACK